MTKPEVIKAIEKRMKENSAKANSDKSIELIVYANRNLDLDWALNLVKQLK